ncbi:hypothetical protein, partial [Arthrobacter mobilis]
MYYLKTVCPTNRLSDAFSDAYQVQVDRYNSGLQPKMAPLKKAAAKLRDSYRHQADAFSDEDVLWPSAVEKDIKKFVDQTFDDVTVYVQVSQSDSLEGMNSIFNEAKFSSSKTAQKVRAKLDLSADTEKSCKKY